ncbi:hypothetical protein [Marinimicrobium alkaliphilum]|uniref:hypothetical protein n=1 Tax=Marinimicrobium alkaliphilum TaxID=2202654 RepID=UPI000DBA7631|nr:hypothetical protein [Marinimicrobium alkaliphilum]
MKTVFSSLALFLLLATPAALAVCDKTEPEFFQAIAVYKENGSQAFIQRILKGGPLENDQRALSQSQSLNQIENFFGKFESGSVLSTKLIGNRTCYLIGVLEYQNGPAFFVATYYQASNGIAATSMFFQTEPEKLLPMNFLID